MLEKKGPLKKELVAQFMALPEIAKWLDGVDLKDKIKIAYADRFFTFLASDARYPPPNGEPPKDFLEYGELMPRDLGIEIKGRIAAITRRSAGAASYTRAAIVSFLNFYNSEVKVNGKIKVRRKRQKPLLTWTQAERIISKAKEPYESAFRFMVWTGCGQDELFEINNSIKIQGEINRQMADPKDYVRIDLEPRKETLDVYYLLCPKKIVPRFPLITRAYKSLGKYSKYDRIVGDWGGKPLKLSDTEYRFRIVATQVGLYRLGMGPHSLRSAFSYQCAKAGVPLAISEFFKGHGGADKYGYNREVMDEEYMLKEIRKMWEFNEPATIGDVKAQAEKIKHLEETLTALMKREAVIPHFDLIPTQAGDIDSDLPAIPAICLKCGTEQIYNEKYGFKCHKCGATEFRSPKAK
jgi:integrase/predicted Zn-ribbon and HTH transcriptional regulator